MEQEQRIDFDLITEVLENQTKLFSLLSLERYIQRAIDIEEKYFAINVTTYSPKGEKRIRYNKELAMKALEMQQLAEEYQKKRSEIQKKEEFEQWFEARKEEQINRLPYGKHS